MEKLEETPEALAFADSLEKACVDTVNVDGIMIKNLAIACGKIEKENYVNTTEFTTRDTRLHQRNGGCIQSRCLFAHR